MKRHVFSTYESRHASSDDKPFARGINSFQLVRIGDDWKVLTIFLGGGGRGASDSCRVSAGSMRLAASGNSDICRHVRGAA